MQYVIKVIPESYPYVLRPCAKCGAISKFYPANEIRINAQKKLLDVWLIHRCEACGQTWNFELFARVAPLKLERELYDRLLANDAELVRQFAFDHELHARKGAPLCLGGLSYRLEGERPVLESLPDGAELLIISDVPLGLRASKLIKEVLGVSGAKLDALISSGAISSPDGLNLAKVKLGKSCRALIAPTII